MDTQRYLEKVYAGLLGKCAGVRLGAPVEPTIWTYGRIRDTYGDITGYIKDYTNFAADDDVNGPLFFVRALIDGDGPLTPQDVAHAWLNYAREGIGFYWWGGYGRSTEHTAYINLKNGMQAPDSGSIRVNGATIAEQIGGQIFIDSWGWVFPADAEAAAHHAGMAASVGHDGNGVYGGRFIAACVSLAFELNDVQTIMDGALATIPAHCEYARVVGAVREFHRNHPGDWRAARDFLTAEWGYDRYPGVCHIIPNAGACALALCYGEGDFAHTIEIATMSGWDTDCNAGNVGAILGVMVGPDGIPDRYRVPINDWHAAASISGALNCIDLPTAARELAIMGLRQASRDVPERWLPGAFSDDVVLDFSLPGSTCGIRSSSNFYAPVAPGRERHREGGVVVVLDRLERGVTVRVYNKPYYRREDFDDERYRPSFTPLAHPGQTLRVTALVERRSGDRIAVAPYVRDARTEQIFQGGFAFPQIDEPFTVEWPLPEVPFAIDEVGLIVMSPDAPKFLGNLVIRGYTITGSRAFAVGFADERKEFDGLSRCSAVGGAWEIEEGGLHVITPDTFQLYSGPYYTTDSEVHAQLVPLNGNSHLLAIRSRGAEYGYFFGLHGEGRACLIRRDHDDVVVAETEFAWQIGRSYNLSAVATTVGDGCEIVCSVDGTECIRFTDGNPHPYGMAGVGKIGAGRTRFISLRVKEH